MLANKPSVTEPMRADEIIISQYGPVTGMEWCHKEILRMQRKGDTNVRLWQHGKLVGITRGKEQACAY